MTFKVKDIPDQTGKVAIVTGANSGIGKVSAMELARKGAHVILACRSAEKTLPVVEEIKKETGNDQVEFIPLDLASLKSVAEFSEAFHAKNLPLHLLLNNAGVMVPPFSLTVDGIESQFATNHVGHFYLTQLLFDVLERSQPSRVVCVSSTGHKYFSGGIPFDKLNDEATYDESTAYGRSKLCNILFARELARRCEEKQIYVNSVHPGLVPSELARHMTRDWSSVRRTIVLAFFKLFLITPLQGASTQLYLGTHSDVEKLNIRAAYYVPIAKPGRMSRLAQDDELAKNLWTFTEELLRSKVPYQSSI